MNDFEPKLLGFLCNWCAYAGADLAGVSRFQYPPNLRVIRVMCSGRVDPAIVVRAFQRGVDGVAVLGCHPGDCHYLTGNYHAERKMRMAKRVLEKVGIDPERLYLDWVSAGEGGRFAELITVFTKRIRELGPLGEREGLNSGEKAERLSRALSIVESERIRFLVGKEWELIEQGNVYGERIDEEEFEELMKRSIEEQYIKSSILSLIHDTPLTVREIAGKIHSTPREIFGYMIYLEEAGLVSLVDEHGDSPRYQEVRQQ